MTPGSPAQFSTRGKMAPLRTRRRDPTRARLPLPTSTRRPGGAGAVRTAEPARRDLPAGAAGASAGPAKRPPARQS